MGQRAVPAGALVRPPRSAPDTATNQLSGGSIMRTKPVLPLLGLVVAMTASLGAPATPAAASGVVTTVSITGLWRNTITCEGLVAAANQAHLHALADTVVAGYFPTLTPDRPTDSTDVCPPGAPAGVTHEHFFTSDGFFGSLDQNDQVVDFGTYEVVNANTVFICSEIDPPTCTSDDFSGLYHFTVNGDGAGLQLDPLITAEDRQAALASPNDFTEAIWMMSVAYAGRPWTRVDCPWC